MKICTILDLPIVYEIIADSEGDSDGLFAAIRLSLLNPASEVFFLEKSAVMIYQRLSNDKWMAHVHSIDRKDRGLWLRDFAVRSGRWILDNRGAKAILNFVPKDRLDLKLFMRMIGSKRIGEIPGTSEILYTSTGDMGIRE